MDSLGSLIDKLTISNIRIWMLEDIKRTSNDDSVVADATRKSNVVNQQRNDLMEEIDSLIEDYISGKKKPINHKSGSTKLYGENK